jgi:hypothetical protein
MLLLRLPSFFLAVWLMFWSHPLAALALYIPVWQLTGARNDTFYWCALPFPFPGASAPCHGPAPDKQQAGYPGPRARSASRAQQVRPRRGQPPSAAPAVHAPGTGGHANARTPLLVPPAPAPSLCPTGASSWSMRWASTSNGAGPGSFIRALALSCSWWAAARLRGAHAARGTAKAPAAGGMGRLPRLKTGPDGSSSGRRACPTGLFRRAAPHAGAGALRALLANERPRAPYPCLPPPPP